MPDKKISQMTADTSLDGSEIVPVVQNGNNRTTAQAIANLAPGTSLSYDPATRLLSSSTGADVTLPEATAQASGLMGSALYSKLDSIVVNRAEITVVPVRNTTGSTIAKGTPVYVPTPGSSGTRLLVAPADASSEATAATTIGLALDAIAHNVDGYVITEGELTGVNTGSLTEGGLVFLSETTGAITSTRPIQPAHGVVLGYCIKQAAGAGGILYVKVDNGLELNELHDVLITSPAAGQVLRRASDGLWKNAQLSAADVGADPAGTAAAAVASHVAAADPHPGVYLTPSDIIAGSGVTVDTTTPGSATISATPLSSATPANLAATASAGTSNQASPADHVHQFQPGDLVIPLSGEGQNLTVSTVLTVPYWPRAQVLTAIPVWMVNTAPTGAALQFDIRIGGTSIFSTLPTIAINGSNSTMTTAAVFSTAFVSGGQTIALGSSVTFHVLQIGSSVAGAGLKVALPIRRAA